MTEITETYKGDINEFVDWISGKNSIDDSNVTNGLPVSGGSIRKLIQSKLKTPLCIYEDIENGLYRMFSSEEAKSLYLSDKDKYGDLEIFNFVRPSDYELNIDLSLNPRYLISGNSNQSASIIAYNWNLKKGTSSASDSVSATYTITDKDNNQQKFSKIYTSVQTAVSLNIYDYLKDGTNTISIELKGISTGATVSVSFIIVVLTLNMETTFDFNAKHVQGSNLQIPYTLSRNVTSIPTSIICYVDEKQVAKVDIPANGAAAVIRNTLNVVNNTNYGQHRLQLWAEIEYDGNRFVSNIMFYTFVTAEDTIALDYYINVKKSLKNVIYPVSELTLTGTQYDGILLEWGYYTNNLQTDTSISIDWKLLQDTTTIDLGSIKVDKGLQGADLMFYPTIYSTEENPVTLKGYFGNKELISIPTVIEKSKLVMYETSDYDFKLATYGRTNTSVSKNIWKDESNSIQAVFTNIAFDSLNGWNDNSFRTVGVNSYATIDYAAFDNEPQNGKTIELEFESEKVVNGDDILITIGSTNNSRIEVTPNKATLYDTSNNVILYTNFKSNERLKLSFIINGKDDSNDSQLVYIINNGVLERAVGCAGVLFANNDSKIKIGGSESGIKFYGMRVYNRAISYTDAYNNYVFDNDNKSQIIAKNNVITNGVLDYDLCVNKIDTILITGDLSKILNQATDKDGSVTDVTIERICPFDNTKNFKCIGCQARKHGQSTLNYPITSMKIWFNKDTKGNLPNFSCPYQANLQLSKNRYKMKDTSIPANKFILQTNYADSSGTSNGGLERLINKTWNDAVIDGEYKLRSEPQLFATNSKVTHTDSVNLNEDGSYVSGVNEDGKQWKDYFDNDFPYMIETGPDSFPCVVFYVNTAGSNTKTYLGQYVFMEDKKSDFCYGERSIYKTSKNDPFCLTIPYKSGDSKANIIWNNNKVLRIEVLAVNSPYSSYLTSDGIEDIVYDANSNPLVYKWEQDFEMIYPDPDDLEGSSSDGTDKFGSNSKYAAKVKPFIDWFKWIVSTKNNNTKFRQEASQHLDLYKLAAYYIFCMRYGLVDSMERNAQIKTYDGVHFHYAPWDMDISMGKKNTGGIAFQPPMDRDTTLPGDNTTYAFSGRSGLKNSATYTSNWLWDALEGWDYWINTIVPKVSQAMFMAGLSYDDITEMFDNEYANKWCEIMYNESCHYKYIDARGGDNAWLAWLQGSGTPYRHWWTSVSSDYYNAKWACGEFKDHYIYVAGVKEAKTQDNVDLITITPTSKTYFNLSKNYSNTLLTGLATKENPLIYDASKQVFSTKEPFVIYGANNIAKLDLSCFATGIDTIGLAGSYSDVLGACIKELNVGGKITKVDDNHYTGIVNGNSGFSMSTGSKDALASLQTIYVRGQQPLISWSEFNTANRTELKNVYAMGSGLANFYSAKSGNNFDKLELPGITKNVDGKIVKSLAFISLNNTTWNNIEFWDTTLSSNNIDDGESTSTTNTASFEKCNVGGDYTLNIPSSLKKVELLGTTASNQNSLNFVLNWVKCIEARGLNIGDFQLKMDGVNWSNITCDKLISFDDLAKIAKFNNGKNGIQDGNMKGYIILNNTQPLTMEQLTQIKSWFGDSCFNKNSAGLVIDHELDYVQINVGSKAYIQNGSVYLKEGDYASLNATKFSLGEDANDYSWFIRAVNSQDTSSVYKSTSLREGDDGTMYIFAEESTNANYQVEILCTSGNFSASTVINIVTATYPTINSFSYISTNLRYNNGVAYFWKPGIFAEFYISLNDFTATVKTVKYTLTDSNSTKLLDNISYEDLAISNNDPIKLDDYLGYKKNATKLYGINLYTSDVTEDMISYTLTARITFKSGYSKQISQTLIVFNDSVAIIQNDGSYVYKIVAANYANQFGSAIESGKYYRTDLMFLDNTFDFNINNGEFAAITSIKTQTNKSLLKYLLNIKKLILSNTSIEQTNNNITDDNKSQLVFDMNSKLEELELENMTQITQDIDLSNNINLLKLSTKGSIMNVVLPNNSKLTQIKYGSPSSIKIKDPISLLDTGVSIDSSVNLNSLELSNISNRSFNTFDKLIIE